MAILALTIQPQVTLAILRNELLVGPEKLINENERAVRLRIRGPEPSPPIVRNRLHRRRKRRKFLGTVKILMKARRLSRSSLQGKFQESPKSNRIPSRPNLRLDERSSERERGWPRWSPPRRVKAMGTARMPCRQRLTTSRAQRSSSS